VIASCVFIAPRIPQSSTNDYLCFLTSPKGDAEGRETLEDTLGQEAEEVRLEGEREPGVPLDVVGRIPGAWLHVDAHPVGARMDREAESMLLAGLVDRIVLALAEGSPRAGIGHHLDKVRVPRPALDLARCGDRILGVHGDRAFEDAVGIVFGEPGVGQPVVEGGGDGGPEVGVRVEVAEGARQEDTIRHAVFVHELLAEEVRIGAGWTSGRRQAIEPRAVDRVAKEAAPAARVAIAPGHW